MPTVKVYPPVGTTAGYCDPDTVSPVGANATIVFQIAPNNPNWSFASSGAIVISFPTPPAGMFTIPNPNSSGNIVVRDRNGDGVKYKYNVNIVGSSPASPASIDPYIQNHN